MACRDAYKTIERLKKENQNVITEIKPIKKATRLLFGVDSAIQSDDLLQNNIEQFEWVVRNKIYPNFYGRYITGDNCLTREEIQYLHGKGCKIALIYHTEGQKSTKAQGKVIARKIDTRLTKLGIFSNVAVFLEIGESEKVTTEFMESFAGELMAEGFTPGFKANTDAAFDFDREYSRGMLTNKDIFKKCLIWSIAPTIKEYNGIKNSHLIHPDEWKPYAPSGTTRSKIAIWQYGVNCHPIEDDEGKKVTFNLDLVLNDKIIIEKML